MPWLKITNVSLVGFQSVYLEPLATCLQDTNMDFLSDRLAGNASPSLVVEVTQAPAMVKESRKKKVRRLEQPQTASDSTVQSSGSANTFATRQPNTFATLPQHAKNFNNTFAQIPPSISNETKIIFSANFIKVDRHFLRHQKSLTRCRCTKLLPEKMIKRNCTRAKSARTHAWES